MPVHDWTRVSAGTFHHFHGTWIVHLAEGLNEGLLPAGFYAMTEQHAGQIIPDVLTLRERNGNGAHIDPRGGGVAVAVAEAPPRTRFHIDMEETDAYCLLQRTLTIRHASNHELVAILEIVSPSNKDRPGHVDDFVRKIISAFDKKIHVLLLDLIPPGAHDPQGIHGAISRVYNLEYVPPPDQPLTMAAYAIDRHPEAYVEPVGVGDSLMDMPLFIDMDWYINTPLERTYAAAFRGMPDVWKEVLEAPAR
jgi:hypothetical protein